MKRIRQMNRIFRGFLIGTWLLGSTFNLTGTEPRVPDYLILGGELGNSSASSAEDIRTIFPQLKEMGLNTVLMPVYWELMEPAEGKYDFSLLDEALSTARG
ncbi:MAG: beta-galactosidase, partial [Muribaculaceae bacterium]|nr:beta-galactosidase [Muribaculaceae bacterium]